MSEVATDSGIYGIFSVPKGYVGSEKIIIRGILDGTLTGTLAFGFEMLARADSEVYDVAFEGQDLVDNGGTWTGYADGDVFETEISLTVTLAEDDDVFYHFFIDDSVNSFAGNFLLTGLFFEYSDA